MPKSSAFNLIQTLLDRGFIYETRKRGGYYPTRRLLELASRIAEGDPFLQNIHGYLQSLAAETGETAMLAVREQAAEIYVEVLSTSSPKIGKESGWERVCQDVEKPWMHSSYNNNKKKK